VPDLAVSCAAWNDDTALLSEPMLVVEILSPSNRADTWANVWSYVTIPNVIEILVLHTDAIRADLLRRQRDGTWPDDPTALGPGDMVTLDNIGFTATLTAFYRTAGL
jgi:Uma2 family endonuclease